LKLYFPARSIGAHKSNWQVSRNNKANAGRDPTNYAPCPAYAQASEEG
jgi:hypothetical protein